MESEVFIYDESGIRIIDHIFFMIQVIGCYIVDEAGH